MKKEKFEEFLENIKLEKFKWYTLTEIESIILNSGRGIYPNWSHIRFLFSNNEILIKHGYSEPYGMRLNIRYAVSFDNMSLSFPPGSVVIDSPYCEFFRLPKAGDIIRSTIGTTKVLSESLIRSVSNTSNMFLIELSNPIKYNGESHLSFYDPELYVQNESVHGTEAEGIYVKFKENDGRSKKYGIQHEIIKIKDIAEIKLKLLKEKTYTVK